jgi:hypothetical protein
MTSSKGLKEQLLTLSYQISKETHVLTIAKDLKETI